MKKIVKSYCVSKIENGLRSFQEDDPRRWSIDIRNAFMFTNKKECKDIIDSEIEKWKNYQTYVPDFKIPEYEIIEVEMRVINQIKIKQ